MKQDDAASSRENFTAISQELNRRFGLPALPDLPPSESGLGSLSISFQVGEIWFDLLHDTEGGDSDDLMDIRAVIGAVPESGADEVLAQLMRWNLEIVRNHAGTLALDPERNELVYATVGDLKHADADEIAGVMEQCAGFVQACHARFPALQMVEENGGAS